VRALWAFVSRLRLRWRGIAADEAEFASDLKHVYPHKHVTLLHSRHRVMPIYPQEMHDESGSCIRTLRDGTDEQS
jgi:hypothetical protein